MKKLMHHQRTVVVLEEKESCTIIREETWCGRIRELITDEASTPEEDEKHKKDVERIKADPWPHCPKCVRRKLLLKGLKPYDPRTKQRTER